MQLNQKTFFLVLFSILSSPFLFAQNVGIGITTPLQKLHVDGTARLNSLAGSGNRMVIANSAGDLATQAIPGGGISGITAGAGLSGGGNSGTIVLDVMVENGLNINATSDRIQLGGTLNQITTINQGAFSYVHNLTGGGNFIIQDNGTNRFAVMANGKTAVGGTATVGMFNVTGNSYFTDDIYLRDGAVTGVPLIRLYDSSDDGVLDIFQSGNAIVNRLHGNGNSFINGGNLGLGTNAPAQRLHVIGTARVSDLAGAGTRMVVTNLSGDLGWQNIPPGGDIFGVFAGPGLSGGGGGGSPTLRAEVNNGLSIDASWNKIQLGGPLEVDTEIDFRAYDLTFDLSGEDFIMKSGTLIPFAVSGSKTYIGSVSFPGDPNLEVVGESAFSDDLIIKDGNLTSGDDLIRMYDSDDDGVMDVYQNNVVAGRIHANGESFLNGGNFGLGTTSPNHPLEINSTALTSVYIENEGTSVDNTVSLHSKLVPNANFVGAGTAGKFEAEGKFTVIGLNTYVEANTGNPLSSRLYGIYANHGNGPGTNYAGFFVGDVYSSGSYLPSFRALKQNIQLASPALSKLMQLQVKKYEYKIDEFENMNLPKGEQTGFMADEIKQVYPGLVKKAIQPSDDSNSEGSDFEFEAVNYTGLIPDLVKGTQEQQEEIEELKSVIQSVNAENQALKTALQLLTERIEALENE